MQQAIVILVVILAALFAAWRLAGPAVRLKLLDALARRFTGRGPLAASLQRQVSRRRAALLTAGCAACASNKTGRHGAA